jgi:tetratricopeptide (TPR) repeat protein
MQNDVRKMEELLDDRRARPPYFASRPYAAMALVHEIRGNSAAADALIGILRNVSTDEDEGGFLTWSPWFGPLLIRRGRAEEAWDLLNRAFEHWRWRGMHELIHEAMCEAVAATGRWNVVPERAAEMRAYAERGGFATLPFAVDRLEGRAAANASDLERAAELFRRSAEGFARLETAWESALSEMLLGETLIALGRRDEAITRLRRALETFERLGAVREQAQARDLLG